MSTTTEAPQAPGTFRERISGIGKDKLIALAKEEYQLNVDKTTTVDTIRDVLQRVHEDRVLSALEKNEAAAQIFLERDKDEQLLSVIFQPLDFPTNPLKFSYDGGYGVRDRKNPKRNPNGLSKMPTFFLIPGQTYQLPICVVNHLKTKVCRDSQPEFDTETGMISGNKPIIKQRFSLNPVLTPETMKNLGSRDFNKKG